MAVQNLSQNSPTRHCGYHEACFEQAFNCSEFGQDPARWLQDRIEYYEAQVAKLEHELNHIKILLRGHKTWLSDIQRRKGAGHE